MNPGDLVRIEQVFFGYDNIPVKWHDSIFIVISVNQTKKSFYQQFICSVLTPEGTIHEFYDYELRDCSSVEDLKESDT